MYRGWLLALLLVVPAALAGCLGDDPAVENPGKEADLADDPEVETASQPADLTDIPTCEHPWPCQDGSEWPNELTGPFELDRIEEVTVESLDGTPLHGYILFPDVPDDVELPVVLWSTLYFGQLFNTPASPTWDMLRTGGDIPVDRLVEEGYAVALFNVRGSGGSGGCYEMFGPGEQQDNVAMVEWLADQEWSNGRVGMSGISYGGTTPWEAAIYAPEGLKTIVPGGIVSDLYTFYHSIQGAPFDPSGAAHLNAWATAFSLAPPTTDSPTVTATSPTRLPDRACPELAELMVEAWKGTVGDDRDADFWGDRRLIDGFPNITASVFLYHGLLDLTGHQTQERDVWETLSSPKRQLSGQWGHTVPNNGQPLPEGYASWDDELVAWLDFWLKGLGPVPQGLGTVDYQDNQGAWHASTAWPPTEAREQALYISHSELGPAPAGEPTTFRSIPHPDGPGGILCDHIGTASTPSLFGDPHPLGVVALTDPVEQPTLVAGNPVAYLEITSDLPGGLVDVHLFRVAEHGACEDEQDGAYRTAQVLGWGTADLRFHDGRMQGTDFPTDQRTPVRVDLTNMAEVLEPGERLAAVVSYGNWFMRDTSMPFTPEITVHADGPATASHLLLPVVEGGLGGAPVPETDYPPRPFLPPGSS